VTEPSGRRDLHSENGKPIRGDLPSSLRCVCARGCVVPYSGGGGENWTREHHRRDRMPAGAACSARASAPYPTPPPPRFAASLNGCSPILRVVTLRCFSREIRMELTLWTLAFEFLVRLLPAAMPEPCGGKHLVGPRRSFYVSSSRCEWTQCREPDLARFRGVSIRPSSISLSA